MKWSHDSMRSFDKILKSEQLNINFKNVLDLTKEEQCFQRFQQEAEPSLIHEDIGNSPASGVLNTILCAHHPTKQTRHDKLP